MFIMQILKHIIEQVLIIRDRNYCNLFIFKYMKSNICMNNASKHLNIPLVYNDNKIHMFINKISSF